MAFTTDIELRQLRVFLAVVDCGGYTPAQSYLNMALPTISAHMSSLETRIGYTLCHRGRSAFKLTEKGEIICDEARKLFLALEKFGGVAERIKGNLAGVLRIGMVDSTYTNDFFSLQKIISIFNKRGHQVDISLEISRNMDLEKALIHTELDIAVGPFNTSNESLDCIPLYTEKMDIFCGQGNPNFDNNKMLTDFDLEKFDTSVRDYWNADDTSRLRGSKCRATVSSLEAQLILLLSGGYIGYLPVHFASRWVETNMLKPLCQGRYSYDVPFSLATKRGIDRSEVVDAFLTDVDTLLKVLSGRGAGDLNSPLV